jgi:hypothetical protein
MSMWSQLAAVGSMVPEDTVPAMVRGLKSEWIEEMLRATGVATLRRRRLPAEQILWLVLGMALMRKRSVVEVAASLDIALPAGGRVEVAPSALVAARQRMGAAPIEWLFRRASAEWTKPAAKYAWRGMDIFAVDGTELRVPDTAENRAYFGRHHSGKRSTPSGYPLVRVVTALKTRTRLIQNAVFGPHDVAELTLARQLLAELPSDSVVILDRLYTGSADLLLVASEANRHFVVKTKKNARMRVVKELSPGDAIVEITVTDEARGRDDSLPRTWTGRAIRYKTPGAEHVLLTSLLDHEAFPAEEIQSLYKERWELELTYDEIKTGILEQAEALRSGTIEGVHQELWATLLAYNLVRLEMGAIANQANVPPSRISFTSSLAFILNEFVICAVAQPGAIPRHLKHLRDNVARFILPPRRPNRTNPRVVKSKEKAYPRKRSQGSDFPLN